MAPSEEKKAKSGAKDKAAKEKPDKVWCLVRQCAAAVVSLQCGGGAVCCSTLHWLAMQCTPCLPTGEEGEGGHKEERQTGEVREEGGQKWVLFSCVRCDSYGCRLVACCLMKA
jgi:hypothetical protein